MTPSRVGAGLCASAVLAVGLSACTLLLGGDLNGDLSAGTVTEADAGVVTADTGAAAEVDTGTCTADLLRDPQNCGSCGRVCATGACTAGTCAPAVIAQEQTAVSSIAAGRGVVVWTRADGKLLYAAQSPSPGDPALVAPSTDFIVGPVVFGTTDFLVRADRTGRTERWLLRLEETTLRDLVFVGKRAGMEAYARRDDRTAVYDDNGLYTCASNCDLWLGDATWSETASAVASSVQLYGPQLYVAEPVTGIVKRCLASTLSSCETIASGQGHPSSLVVDDGGASWINETSGEVMHCPLAGCPSGPTQVRSAGLASGVAQIVSTGTHLVWGEPSRGTLVRCPRSACATPETIAAGLATPKQIARDGQKVFVYESDARRIVRVDL